ncbi:single-stranded DNA-binding protein [uncultured Acidaminococcus sp.]|uniref:single-stranded DNA-binding protein n=1 Tax=uncultured Acidaminococcus sp. TaxID=352152 RepID=UPI002598B54E|nr:single-stranded DNA-binding protein [uncultured Acidaminococcus sp.]
MNRIILLGRLVRDPEVKVTSTQKTYCTFTLAVDRPFIAKSGQREADFIPIQTWNKTAEICGNSLSKGQRLLVEGRLQIRSYDGKDGKKHYTTEVIANRVEFIERKEKNAQTANTAPKQGFESMGQDVTQQFNEEIPF